VASLIADAPSRIAKRMYCMRGPVFAVVVALTVLAVPTTISYLSLRGATVSRDWTQARPATTNPAGTGGTYVPAPLVEKPLSQVWREWHSGNGLSPIEIIFFVATPLSLVLIALIAFVLVPETNADGPWMLAVKAGARIATVALLVLVILIAVFGSVLVAVMHADLRGARIDDQTFLLFIPCLALATLFGLATWTVRAARSVRSPGAILTIPPRCEKCGYDLTHVPDSGLCPECGFEAHRSLTPGAARPGTPFERGVGPTAWLHTTRSVLFDPARFYRTLVLCNGCDRADRFQLGLFAAIAFGAWIWWLFCIALGTSSRGFELLFAPVIFTLAACLCGWATHRVAAAIIGSAWIVRRELPSADWIRKIIRYESAYLLAFCAFDGACVTFGVFWLSSDFWRYTVRPFLRDAFGGFDPEAGIMFGGNVLLILFWFWRYRIALRNVRWANY